MSLGNDLRTLRKSKKISQEQVAKDLNISRQSISKWENDVCSPDIENLMRLSKYYNVPLINFIKEKELDMKNSLEIDDNKLLASNSKSSNKKDEGLILLVTTLMCFLIPPIGVIIVPTIIKRNKAENTLYKLIYISCIFCLIANVFMGYGIITDVLGIRDTSVELIK